MTGAAGFIGSTLAELLVSEGHSVLGVDCFTDYYSADAKQANLGVLLDHPRFSFSDADLRHADCRALLEGIDVVFHLAAQPGVRLSWAEGFPQYADHNILVTQRLLEAARTSDLRRFVFASSSSVYGDRPGYPTTEGELPKPNSPYGVTKLAAEHLCGSYAANWAVPTVALRFFTVYGPRQRPDMAINRLIAAGLTGKTFPLFGDGGHIRDFTFVGDVVSATLAAAVVDVPPGEVFNVAGGSSTLMRDLIALVSHILGREIAIEHHPPQAGDVMCTQGSIERASDVLGWKPKTPLAAGVAQQVAWQADSAPADLGRIRARLSAAQISI